MALSGLPGQMNTVCYLHTTETFAKEGVIRQVANSLFDVSVGRLSKPNREAISQLRSKRRVAG
jgi:hypothetical protein